MAAQGFLARKMTGSPALAWLLIWTLNFPGVLNLEEYAPPGKFLLLLLLIQGYIKTVR